MRRLVPVAARPLTLARLAVPAVAGALVLAACGGDPAPPLASAPPIDPPSTATASGSPTASGGPGCPLLTSPAPGATVVRVTVTGKDVQTPSRTVSVKLGSTVRLEVTADVVDQVHVHTYDEHLDTIPSCPVALEFQARIPGTVEVELEKAHLHLVEIKAS